MRLPRPVQALTGEHPGELVAQLLVHPEKKADLPHPHPDIPGRDVGLRPDMAGKFRHEALAETHDLKVRFSLGVEIGASLPSPQGKGGEAVLENLFKGEKLHDPEIHRGVKTQPPLIGSEGAVHFHPESPVYLDLALVVHPGHPEDDDPLGFGDPFKHRRLPVFRVMIKGGLHAGQHFLDRLVKFLFPGIPVPDIFHEVVHLIPRS